MKKKGKETMELGRFRKLVDKEKSRDSMSKKMAEQGLSCNTSTITKHYNGDRSISTEYVIKYAKYFGVSTDYLLGLSNVPVIADDKALEHLSDMLQEEKNVTRDCLSALTCINELTAKICKRLKRS